MIERRVVGPEGREWVVRSYRYRRPPWRAFQEGVEDESSWYGPLGTFAFLLAPVFAFFTAFLVPLLVFLVEAPVAAVASLFSDRRYVEAAHEGPPASRMTWRVPADGVEPVVDQVARQLELGYERIQPHNAEFLGFGRAR